MIVEGYAEYATWRPHLAYLRDPFGDPDMEMDLDGIGGVSILVKAKVFRAGVHFPAFSFERHAETEAFGKVYYPVTVGSFLFVFNANYTKDGPPDGFLGCWAPTLHDLAFIRAQCRRSQTHGRYEERA